MDPNENLRVQRELAATLIASDVEEGAQLAEHVQALDEWISRGGFLPAAWQRETPTFLEELTEHADDRFASGEMTAAERQSILDTVERTLREAVQLVTGELGMTFQDERWWDEACALDRAIRQGRPT